LTAIASGIAVLALIVVGKRLCGGHVDADGDANATGDRECVWRCCEGWLHHIGKLAFFLYAGVGASVTVVVGWVASWWKVSQLSPRLRREREQAIAGLVVGWGDIAAATQSTPGQGAGDMTCQAASVELVQRARGVQQAREDVEEETERLLTHGDK
jgi:hypothetical protein